MAYTGSCHCGDVAFQVEGDAPTEAISCNCSHCRRKGFLLTFVPSEALSVQSGEDRLTAYRFNAHKIAHEFCQTCGAQAFCRGQGPDGKDMAAINLRCVPAIDLDALTISKVDGASF